MEKTHSDTDNGQPAFVEETWTSFAQRKAYLPQLAVNQEYPGGGVPDNCSRFPVGLMASFDHRQLLDELRRVAVTVPLPYFASKNKR